MGQRSSGEGAGFLVRESQVQNLKEEESTLWACGCIYIYKSMYMCMQIYCVYIDGFISK